MNSLSYHLVIDGEQQGPFTLEQLRGIWRAGRVNLGTQFWSDDGYPDWRPLSEIVDVIEPPVRRYAAPTKAVSRCGRGVFVLLGIFLGGLGVHNFYAGYIGRGLAQLGATVLVGWFIWPLVAVWVWVIVELFAVTEDAKGREFY